MMHEHLIKSRTKDKISTCTNKSYTKHGWKITRTIQQHKNHEWIINFLWNYKNRYKIMLSWNFILLKTYTKTTYVHSQIKLSNVKHLKQNIKTDNIDQTKQKKKISY